MAIIFQDFQEKLTQCQTIYNKLLIILGKFGAGKTRFLKSLSETYGYPYFNLNLELSAVLMKLTKGERHSFDIRSIFSEEPRLSEAEIVLFDNIELIFNPELKWDPLAIFLNISREKTIIVGWPGEIRNQKIIYAQPKHAEYFEGRVKNILTIDLNNSGVKNR